MPGSTLQAVRRASHASIIVCPSRGDLQGHLDACMVSMQLLQLSPRSPMAAMDRKCTVHFCAHPQTVSSRGCALIHLPAQGLVQRGGCAVFTSYLLHSGSTNVCDSGRSSDRSVQRQGCFTSPERQSARQMADGAPRCPWRLPAPHYPSPVAGMTCQCRSRSTSGAGLGVVHRDDGRGAVIAADRSPRRCAPPTGSYSIVRGRVVA
jgi:hypothetical protein